MQDARQRAVHLPAVCQLLTSKLAAANNDHVGGGTTRQRKRVRDENERKIRRVEIR